MVLDLAIPEDLPPATKIKHMAACFRTAQAKAAKNQEELTLQVAKLHLKAQPPTPPAERERCRGKIVARLETMSNYVRECSGLLDQLLGILTSLQEDPTIQ